MTDNRIEFQFDRAHRIVIARPRWTITTEADCARWYHEYESYFSGLGKGPFDVIFVLDEFTVAPDVLSTWGKYRAEMVSKFTRHSFRVNASRRVITASYTSAALYNAASDEAPDIESATAGILAARDAEDAKNRSRTR